ncbi:MAG TPA: LysR substrate-binding domain-containing protein [Hypericibacter adhaerens]|jgi:LysR family glycine cleavage system transcriptional activator|uniref:Transcriptional regulator n=1 Tax=Hypericibacter adhaerens TaxID=2602016 RepID=A0A5J6MZG2_9PROT|nr:LysR substrate-binding domain-containing protein [Hypericibacter adhaerens]QEX22025.1 transcriptional regulator [Hypericibacter adhaerens]HWA46316.1 LysR substrate-binding domain-containing protein [Hypericibacter adhaerens]
MRRLLNLNWIRSFEASARHLSFTGAARELNMTQAGVSQHIRLLEGQLRESLFHRLPRGLQLTDAGEAYLRVVRESFDHLTFGTDEIFGHGEEGLVTVRTNVAFATHWLAPRLARFHARFPAIALRLTAAVHGLDTVWEGVDLEIRYGHDHATGLSSQPVTTDRLFPVCAPALAGSLKEPRDLLRQRLIHVIGNRQGWTDWFAAAGLRDVTFDQVLQTDTSAIGLELAAEGVGIALGHSSLVKPMIAANRLARPFAAEIDAQGPFYLVSPSDRPMRPEARSFKGWLLDEAAAEIEAAATPARRKSAAPSPRRRRAAGKR